MKILHLVPSYKPAFIYGGPIISVSRLCESQAALGYQVSVYTTTANGKEELPVETNKAIELEGLQVSYFPRITGDHTHISPALWRHLWKTVGQYDVVHIHSWWNFLVLGAVLVCVIRGVRPVLSVRGMLSTYSFTHDNSLKKRLLHTIVGKWLLQHTYLHATTQSEWEDCQQIIPSWKGFIAPNIVALPGKLYERNPDQVFTIGTLSRIDPVKRVDMLIRALGQVNFQFQLLIAGSGEVAYLDFLKHLTEEVGIADRVEWVGWKNGEEKYQFLAKLDLLALTSYTENFANVVIESLSVGIPVLVSNKVGLYSYVATNNFGWVCELHTTDIKQKLEDAQASQHKRDWIRNLAPKQIRKDFSGKSVTEKYIQNYQSILN